ncbi:MAG: TRAP transporter large permease [Rhodospirillaceae bacterium]|nr:TRAP transporter large permease [Rhodospirillaceae bacterium]
MDPIILGAIGLGAMFVLIALHVPIGIAMGITGVTSVAFIIGWEPALTLIGTEPSAAIANEGLAVVALFLLMGAFATEAGVSGDMYRLAYALIGHFRGGLAMATIGGCAGFGAICGSSIATTATMAKIALPEMLQRNYLRTLASGSIAAGGTLGMLVPPSVVMIVYGILTEESVLALFAAAIFPGIIATVLYCFTIAIYVRLRPDSGPAGERVPWREKLDVLIKSWRFLLIAVVVSGGIYTGIFTITEAASVGASLAFIFAIFNGMNMRSFLDCLTTTASNTGMIFVIIMGASIFSYFISLSGLPDASVEFIKSLHASNFVILLMMMIMYLILGSIFDTVAAMVITLPFVYPVIIDMGYDPIWWGVVNVMIMEIGMITPPIGINVFVLNGMSKDLNLKTIYTGIFPFFLTDLVRLSIVLAFPATALWLPTVWGLM